MRVVTALYINTATEFVIGLDAGQHLRKMHWVGIAKNLGHIVHHAQIPLDATICLLLDR
jgi:hypothetical protein